MRDKFKSLLSIFLVLTFSIMISGSVTKAEELKNNELPFIGDLEHPFENTNSNGSIYVKGWALSPNKVNSVQVFIDNVLYGNANIALERTDIYNKYPDYNEKNSGFDMQVKNIKDGKHILKVVITDEKNNKLEKQSTIIVDNSKKTPIMGQATLDKLKMEEILMENNPNKDKAYIRDFVNTTIEEANSEDVRYDIAFAQMMLETNFLKFGGDVSESQNNFAGLGATGNGEAGESFPSMKIGIRAVIQHLKAYASKEPLVNECVDNRFKYVTRGSAVYLENLGINENPYGLGWATSKDYGYSIENIMKRMEEMEIELPIEIKKLSYEGELKIGNTITLKVDANRDDLEYRFQVKDSKGNYTTLKAYSKENTVNWKVSNDGNFKFIVNARDKSGQNLSSYLDVNVKAAEPLAIKEFSYDGELKIGNTIKLNATSNRENAEYRFQVKDDDGNYSTIKAYDKKNSIEWKIPNDGNFKFIVNAKDESGNVVSSYLDIIIEKPEPLKITGFSYEGNLMEGNTIKLKANSNKETSEYRFQVKDSSGNYTTIKAYGKDNIVDWKIPADGNYKLILNVKDNSGTVLSSYLDIAASKKKPLEITSFSYVGELVEGNNIQLKSSANFDNVDYRFQVKNSKGEYTTLKTYGKENIVNWNPTERGQYMLIVNVKDSDGEVYSKYLNVLVDGKEALAITDFSYDGILSPNNVLTLKANGNRDNLQYKFQVKDGKGNYTTIKGYDNNNSVQWKIPASGEYMLIATIQDSKTNQSISSYIGIITNKKLIVVDPGHNYGGDYGAESTIDGVTYKETELDMFIAVKLKSELEKLGYSVILTRQPFERPMDDLYTSITNRVDLANGLNADAFISIHHDSSSSMMAKGATTFYSSWKSGLDNTDIVDGKDPNGYDWYDLKVDLTPTQQAITGRNLAKEIVNNLSGDVNYSNRKEHDRNLGVTKRTNMPAVLVECGFITNPDEAKKAADPNNQQKIAESIAKSVKSVIN